MNMGAKVAVMAGSPIFSDSSGGGLGGAAVAGAAAAGLAAPLLLGGAAWVVGAGAAGRAAGALQPARLVSRPHSSNVSAARVMASPVRARADRTSSGHRARGRCRG